MNTSKIHIAFIIPSIKMGGAPRVIMNICEGLDKSNYLVDLIILEKENTSFYKIPSGVKTHYLETKNVRKSLPKILKFCWKNKPDILFSTLGHLNLFLSIFKFLFPKSLKIIGRETAIVSARHKMYSSFYQFYNNLLYKLFYNNLDVIICQSKFMLNDLTANYRLDQNKMKIINNPVNTESILKQSNEDSKNHPFDFITIGRLAHVKQYDVMINAFKLLQNKNHTLGIIGDGDDLDDLKKLVRSLSLEKNIFFLGPQINPFTYLKNSKLYLLTSLFEGFPNAVLEAGALGIPIVAFNCPGGLAEIVEDGFNGLLVNERNIQNFANTIETALETNFDHEKIKAYTFSNFGFNKIISIYDQLFHNLLLEQN